VLRCSRYGRAFQNMGAVFLYHDLLGSIVEMSPDVADVYFAFRQPADRASVEAAYTLDGIGARDVTDALVRHHLLVAPDREERDVVWSCVGVRAKWAVWRRDPDGGVHFYAGFRGMPVHTVRLDPEEAAVWGDFDGRTRLRELAARHGEGRVLGVVSTLVHHDVQAVKLSPVPLPSPRPGAVLTLPPHLQSTMPYPLYDPDRSARPDPFAGSFRMADYHAEIACADAQFDDVETTLSHLFRRPHPALGGQTYGQRLALALLAEPALAGPAVRALEIGGGLGYVARDVVHTWLDAGKAVHWDILELSPALAAAQRERTVGLPVSVFEGDALATPWPAPHYDLILANEMVGDLPARRVAPSTVDATLAARLAKYGIPLDATEESPTYLNTGAWDLLERVAAHLNPGGLALLTEFGERDSPPRLSTHLDHPEVSIRFRHLESVAHTLGLLPELKQVTEVVGLRGDSEALSTTRSYFRALRAMLAELGIEIAKIAYTREMLDELLSPIEPETLGELHFEPLGERVMGIKPHEFKALFARRPRRSLPPG
jgi:hypothetical protein